MTEEINDPPRRFLGATAITIAATQLGIFGSADARAAESTPPSAAPLSANAGAAADESIRPFHFRASHEELVDLRRRIAATRWPERETVSDTTQGVQLATMQALARYWGTDYDWLKVEARLKPLPQFVTNIDGLDIHFIHVRSKNANALPIIVTHG